MKKGLSVCLATYNEEANIKQTLSSVIDWVEEIVLVDGKSTDDTVKLAKAFGKKVQVYLFDNPPNFLLNRQRAMDKAGCEWILVLDADEIVSEDLKQEILKTIKQSEAKNGYNLPRLNFFLGHPLRKGGVYPDYCLRLFKNGAGKIPLKTVHDQVEIKGEVGFFKAGLEHYSYPSFQVYLRKWIQYCDFEADKLLSAGQKPNYGLWVQYVWLKPMGWFLKTYFRHKGFQDGFPGFVFSLFSALRFMAIYIKLYEKSQ